MSARRKPIESGHSIINHLRSKWSPPLVPRSYYFPLIALVDQSPGTGPLCMMTYYPSFPRCNTQSEHPRACHEPDGSLPSERLPGHCLMAPIIFTTYDCLLPWFLFSFLVPFCIRINNTGNLIDSKIQPGLKTRKVNTKFPHLSTLVANPILPGAAFVYFGIIIINL